MKKVLIVGSVLAVLVTAVALVVVIRVNRYRKNNPAQFAREGSWAKVEEIITNNPSWASRTDSEGRTALHYVEDENIARLLIQGGADVNKADIYGFTPLHTVFIPGVVSLLLDSGADLSVQSISGLYTPLHTTVNIATLNSSLKAHMIENAPAKEARYVFPEPLHEYRVQKAKLLLERGIEVNTQGRHKETALDITTDEELRDLLVEHGGRNNTKGWEKKRPK